MTDSAHQGQSDALAQKVTPKWQNIQPQHWLKTLGEIYQSSVTPKDRLYWMSTMRHWLSCNVEHRTQDQAVYCNKSWMLSTLESICLVSAEVAYQLCDWPMVIEVHAILDKLERQSDAELPEVEKLQLAVALWQMGQLVEAEKLLLTSMTDLGLGGNLEGFYQQVLSDLSRMNISIEARTVEDILICPLEEQHLSGFSWVYQDAQIAKLCNLPEFNTDEQWFDWLGAENSNEAKQVFAVNHRQWGFIGSVSIEVHDGVGFFYYWLGQDFQGGGYGPQAVMLMLDLAQKYMDMTCCYAKVYDYNLPSQKAMSKMGFKPLPFKIAPPNQNQFYFYRGPQISEAKQLKELTHLMSHTDVGNRLVIS